MSDIAKMIAIAKKFGGSGAPSAPAEVVILPETELTYTEDMGTPAYTTLLQAMPKGYTLFKVTYNGMPFDCICVEQNGLMFGNAAYMAGVDNGMPFLCVVIPDGAGNLNLMCLPLDGAASVTMSITQVESQPAGVYVVNVECDPETADGYYTNTTKDKTYNEIEAAYAVGNLVLCRLRVRGHGGRYEYAMREYDSQDGFSFAPAGASNQYASDIAIYPDDIVEAW